MKGGLYWLNIRAPIDPTNSWDWYEVSKAIMATSVDQLYEYAERNGITTNREAMIDGYSEYAETRGR